MANRVNSGSDADRAFIKKAMKKPLLDADHESKLARRWKEKNCEKSLHELTQAYMRLVVSMASKFRHYGLPLSDLIQEGNIGLMQAAARFEPAREVRFSTYASWWIRSSIQDYVLRNWSIVRTGTTAAQKSLFFNLRRLRAQIDDTGDSIMTQENKKWVADTLGVGEKDVEAMASRLSGADRSLNAPLTMDGDSQWQDLLPDTAPQPEEEIMESMDGEQYKVWIAEALGSLNDRETFIIKARRLSEDSITLESLGKQLGISKERVRQIEHNALNKLRKALTRIMGEGDVTAILASL